MKFFDRSHPRHRVKKLPQAPDLFSFLYGRPLNNPKSKTSGKFKKIIYLFFCWTIFLLLFLSTNYLFRLLGRKNIRSVAKWFFTGKMFVKKVNKLIKVISLWGQLVQFFFLFLICLMELTKFLCLVLKSNSLLMKFTRRNVIKIA